MCKSPSFTHMVDHGRNIARQWGYITRHGMDHPSPPLPHAWAGRKDIKHVISRHKDSPVELSGAMSGKFLRELSKLRKRISQAEGTYNRSHLVSNFSVSVSAFSQESAICLPGYLSCTKSYHIWILFY
jgi:hypothetical protein